MKKILLCIIATFVFTFGSVVPVAAEHKSGHSGGANQSGDFDSTQSNGDNQGNGNAPENGSVGNADDKNPPGQAKNDNNNGYECDNNKGVGDKGGNPAHTGCVEDEEPTTTTTVKGHTPTTVKDNTKTSSTVIERSIEFETKLQELRTKQAAGVVLTPEEEDVALEAEAQLAMTGPGDNAIYALGGIALICIGFALVRLSAKK